MMCMCVCVCAFFVYTSKGNELKDDIFHGLDTFHLAQTFTSSVRLCLLYDFKRRYSDLTRFFHSIISWKQLNFEFATKLVSLLCEFDFGGFVFTPVEVMVAPPLDDELMMFYEN